MSTNAEILRTPHIHILFSHLSASSSYLYGALLLITNSLVRVRSRVVSSLQEIASCIARNTRFLLASAGK